MTLFATLYILIGGIMIGLAAGVRMVDVSEGRRTRKPMEMAVLGTLSALAGVVLTVWQP